MKRCIKAATETGELHPYFDGVPPLDCMDISGHGINPVFTYTGAYPEFGPKMTVTPDTDERGRIWFVPTIWMPKCNGDQLDYWDSFKYLADRYAEVAAFASYLMDNPLIPEQWEDEAEE